jgi:hypothetical protein
VTHKLPTPYSLLPIRFDPGLLVAALLALFAVAPLLAYPGLPNTADGPVHLMRQAELNQAWQDGILYPRWAPDLAYGYGMPLFHYAPPLLYQVTQLIHLTGLPLDTSMKGTLILAMLLYSVGMYLFARDLFGPRAGLLAAAVYLYAPYRLREAYIQGNYGQFLGLAFYPLILWSFHGLVVARRLRYLPLVALSLAGLLLSHNISAMMFVPLFGAYLVFLIGTRGSKGAREQGSRGARGQGGKGGGEQGSREAESQAPRSSDAPIPDSPIPNLLVPNLLIPNLLISALALAMGLGLSAFFWLPAFAERDLIRLAGITRGFFDFRHNFISLPELLALPRRLDLSAINPYYPLSLGLPQIVFAALALLGLGAQAVFRISYFVLRVTNYVLRFTSHAPRIPQGGSKGTHHAFPKGDLSARIPQGGPIPTGDLRVGTHHVSRFTPHALFFAVALLASAFLALPYSQPIWEALPLLELAEFPWRWLGPALLCAAVLAAAALHMVEEALGRSPLHAPRSTLHAPLAIGLGFTLAANLFYLFPAQFIPWGTPAPANAVAYEADSGAIGTTSTGEFLPRWADRYPSPQTLGPDYAAGRLPAKVDPATLPPGASALTLAHTARETHLAVSSPAPFTATFRALYWPGWRVLVTAGPEDADGQPADVQITQPDGLMRAHLPAGEYYVKLHLFPTPIRQVATVISVLSLLTLLGLIAVWKVGRLAVRSPLGKGWMDASTFQSSILPTFQALVVSAALLAGLLITRPLAAWFRVQSPPDSVVGAQVSLRADFGGQVRLLAFDLPANLPIYQSTNFPSSQPPKLQAQAGSSLPIVLYWRALAPLRTDYSVFVHLDAPDGQTAASADELNPEDIPTSHWPASLYLRNPLTLPLPADLPPIRYKLTAGLYDPHSGARLPLTGCDGCQAALENGDTLPLAYVWLLPETPLEEQAIPQRLDYRLGDTITLLGYELTTTDPAALTLYWRTLAPEQGGVAFREGSSTLRPYTIFIHALDAGGEIVAQFDAPPLNGLYPTDAWLPSQLIADTHTMTLPASTRTLAVGLYDTASLARLPVTDRDGQRLPDDAIRLPVTGSR